MKTTTGNSMLDLLCQQGRLSSEPIAVLDEDGEVAFINSAMQDVLPGGTLSARTRAALTGSNARRLVALGRSDEQGRTSLKLFAIPLENCRLITLLEHEDDPRIQRLQAQLEDAQKRSMTDSLTGVWNRKQFDEFLRIEIPRAERYGQPICLLVLDIDHFKRVNDEYGHTVGDEVLRQVSDLIRQQIRLVDSLFRWGGEEFTVLLPNTSLSAARFISERLRQAIGQVCFDAAGVITVSIGAAELERGETAEAWFKRADDALYEAKNQGRDQVICAEANADLLIGGEDGDSPVLMPWKSIYESGHPLIDQQHRELFRMGNRLIAASLDENVGKEDFLRLADELIEHCAQHFSDEENILAEIEYGDLEQHHKAHNGLLTRARKLRNQARTGTVNTRDVIDFLVNKLVKQHLLTADMAFFPQLTKPSAARS